MTTRQASAAERLPEHLASRLEDFRAMLAREADEDYDGEGDDELGPINEYGLGISVSYAIRVDLSTGGPADYITAIVDSDGAVTEATYHFADWFDHASRTLEGEEREVVETYLNACLDMSAGSMAEYIR